MATKVWSDLAKKNALVGYLDLTLRGASQVYFQNYSLTGLMSEKSDTRGACGGSRAQVTLSRITFIEAIHEVVVNVDEFWPALTGS